MNKLTPLFKGIIIGIAKVILFLGLYYSNLPPDSKLQYSIHILYAIGIIWALISYSRSASFTGKFADLFGQGFRCFIVVTLIMAAFTAIFYMLNPQIADDAARFYREDLVKEGNKTPSEIEELVTTVKKQYTTSRVSLTIFGYLITGTLITAAGSALLMRRN